MFEHCLQRESDKLIVFHDRKTFGKSDCKEINDRIMHINNYANELIIDSVLHWGK